MIELFTKQEKENLIKQKKVLFLTYVLIGIFALFCMISGFAFWRTLGKTLALVICSLSLGGYTCYSLVFWQMNAYRRKKLELFSEEDNENFTAYVKAIDLDITTLNGLQFFTITVQIDEDLKALYFLSDFSPRLETEKGYIFSIRNKIIYAYGAISNEEVTQC